MFKCRHICPLVFKTSITNLIGIVDASRNYVIYIIGYLTPANKILIRIEMINELTLEMWKFSFESK